MTRALAALRSAHIEQAPHASWTAPALAEAIRGFLKGSLRAEYLETGTAVELLADAAAVLRRPGALHLSPVELGAVLAGLRLLEACLIDGTAQNIGEAIGDVLTNMRKHRAIDGREVDALCQRLNATPTPNRVVVTVDGGVVQAINADHPAAVDVTVLDFDVDGEPGAEHPSVHRVTGARGRSLLVAVGGGDAQPLGPELAGVLQQIASQDEEAAEMG